MGNVIDDPLRPTVVVDFTFYKGKMLVNEVELSLILISGKRGASRQQEVIAPLLPLGWLHLQDVLSSLLPHPHPQDKMDIPK